METDTIKREVKMFRRFRLVGIDDNRSVQQTRNASVTVLYLDVVQPVALHIDKRFVELLGYDDEHQINKKGSFTMPSPPKTERCHQCESQFYEKSISSYTYRRQL